MELFEALASDPERLLPEFQKTQWINATSEGGDGQSMRVICDYVAGMTDDFASRMHRSLFVAGDGSVFQRI